MLLKFITFIIGSLIFSLSFLVPSSEETVGNRPVLPSTSYEYSNLAVPHHVLQGDSLDIGYSSGTIRDKLFSVTDERATLGRVLFYDNKLSGSNAISCGSCHKQEKSFADDVVKSEGIQRLTNRNSLQLNDLGWSDNYGFFWDLTSESLEEAIKSPLLHENEIDITVVDVVDELVEIDYYEKLFIDAYGDERITADRIVDALSTFIRSMTTFNSKFDRESARNFIGFSNEELAGKDLFRDNCNSCHTQGTFVFYYETQDLDRLISSGRNFFDNGLSHEDGDTGIGGWGNNGRDFHFKVPTLRNIELTGPYMHNGSLETLEDVVDFYSEDVEIDGWNAHIRNGGFNFSETEKAELIAFMKTFTDYEFVSDIKWSDPFDVSSSISALPSIVLNVYPNPVSDKLYYKSDKSIQNISVFDDGGRPLIVKHGMGVNGEIALMDLLPGAYFIQFSTEDAKITKRVIKE